MRARDARSCSSLARQAACRRSCSSARLAVVTSSERSVGSSSSPGRWTTANTSCPATRTLVASLSPAGDKRCLAALGIDPLPALEAVEQRDRRVAEGLGEPGAYLARHAVRRRCRAPAAPARPGFAGLAAGPGPLRRRRAPSAAASARRRARSVGSLETKPRSRPWTASTPHSRTAATAGTRTGADQRRRAGEARTIRASASRANAAAQAAVSASPMLPERAPERRARSRGAAGWPDTRCSLARPGRTRPRTPPRAPRPRCRTPPPAARQPVGRVAARPGRASAAAASNGGHAAYRTSPGVNAGPAAGVFHSVTSQASAVAGEEHREDGARAPGREAAAPSRTAAASARRRAPQRCSPASVSSGSRRTMATVTAATATSAATASHGQPDGRGGALTTRTAPTGSSASSRVPAPTGLADVSRPPRASTRSISPRRPEPRAGSAPPRPSSATRTTRPWPPRATLDRGARRVGVLGDVGQCLRADEVRPPPPAPPGTDATARPPRRGRPRGRPGRASASARPCSVSALGWTPCAKRVRSVRRGVELVDELVDVGAPSRRRGARRSPPARRDASASICSAPPRSCSREAATLLVTRLDEPATRRRDLAHAGGVLGLEPHVGQDQPHRGDDRLGQGGVAQRGGVVHERRHRRPAVLHERDDALLALLRDAAAAPAGRPRRPSPRPPGRRSRGRVAHGPGRARPAGPEAPARSARWTTRPVVAARTERPETRSTASATAVRTIAAS